MQVVVLASESQREELRSENADKLVWITSVNEVSSIPAADAYLDLAYVNTPERNGLLASLLPALVIINSVTDTLPETNPSFVRMNGWSTFLASPVWEAACHNNETIQRSEQVFSLMGKKAEWMADEPGFLTARVVSMIINEAFLALAEGVSTTDEINTAMKLGTAYPYGPFEWAETIGLHNVVSLLQKLSQTNARYTPAESMVKKSQGVS